MKQTLTYRVTVGVDNTKGIGHNADRLASNIVGWGCSVECEGAGDFESVIVEHESGALVEWGRTGGKKD